MTPIEKLRKWADCAWDAPDELRLLLAAYDARGKYIVLLEQNQKEYSHHTGHISDRDRATCTRRGCRLHQAKKDADCAVAAVEGGKA